MTQSRLLKYVQSDTGNLRLNPKHQVAASHALNIYSSGAIYTFIPKNACSTMRLSLAIANGCSRIEWLTVAAKADTAAFYDAIGSTAAGHMAVRRLHGDALRALAAG